MTIQGPIYCPICDSRSAAMMEPNDESQFKVMAEVRNTLAEAEEKELLKGYQEDRTCFGEMNFRRVEWK